MIGLRRSLLCASALLFLIGPATKTAAQEVALAPADGAAIDRAVSPYVSSGDFMGVVAVQRDGKDPLILPYGLASVELGVPHSADSVFMIGSVSKQFTAVAILLLEQEGTLKVSDLVSAHLVDFKPDVPMTIEHLLVHTSGVADVYSLERFGESAGQVGSFAEVVRDLGHMDLTHPPGTSYAYSNGGYTILAAIIEHVSGVAYGDFLADRLFAPLGMASTFHDRPGPFVKNRVGGYDPWGRNALTAVPPVSAGYTTGSGSLWSTAADLLVWTEALHSGRLLTESSYAKFIGDHGNGYGYGVSAFRRFRRDVIGHDGRVAGYASDVARYVEDRMTVVVLSNVQSVARDEIRHSVAATLLDEPLETPAKRVFVDQPTEPIDGLLGVYSFGPGFEVSISESAGRLLARANQGGFSELVPTSGGGWFSRMLYTPVRFGKDEAGLVDRLIWGRGDRAPVGRRIR